MNVQCGVDSSVLRKVKWELFRTAVRSGFTKGAALDIQWLRFNKGTLNVI
jgi:hypothetical protein